MGWGRRWAPASLLDASGHWQVRCDVPKPQAGVSSHLKEGDMKVRGERRGMAAMPRYLYAGPCTGYPWDSCHVHLKGVWRLRMGGQKLTPGRGRGCGWLLGEVAPGEIARVGRSRLCNTLQEEEANPGVPQGRAAPGDVNSRHSWLLPGPVPKSNFAGAAMGEASKVGRALRAMSRSQGSAAAVTAATPPESSIDPSRCEGKRPCNSFKKFTYQGRCVMIKRA